MHDLGNLDEAQKLYNQCIEWQGISKNAATYYCSIAVLLYKKNKAEDAFEKIISATKINQ